MCGSVYKILSQQRVFPDKGERLVVGSLPYSVIPTGAKRSGGTSVLPGID